MLAKRYCQTFKTLQNGQYRDWGKRKYDFLLSTLQTIIVICGRASEVQGYPKRTILLNPVSRERNQPRHTMMNEDTRTITRNDSRAVNWKTERAQPWEQEDTRVVSLLHYKE